MSAPTPMTTAAARARLAAATSVTAYDVDGARPATAADVLAALRVRGVRVSCWGDSWVVLPFPGRRGSPTRFVVKP